MINYKQLAAVKTIVYLATGFRMFSCGLVFVLRRIELCDRNCLVFRFFVNCRVLMRALPVIQTETQ